MMKSSRDWEDEVISLENEVEELQGKLDEIQKIVDITYDLDSPIDGYIPTKAMYKIKKILED